MGVRRSRDGPCSDPEGPGVQRRLRRWRRWRKRGGRGEEASVPSAAQQIRWDRLGRIAMLAMLAGVFALYIGPARSYWSTWHEAKDRRAQVQRLQADHDRLEARKAALRNPRALEREARRLGMVHTGERAYVVKGLPDG